jgi:hypothetical protein
MPDISRSNVVDVLIYYFSPDPKKKGNPNVKSHKPMVGERGGRQTDVYRLPIKSALMSCNHQGSCRIQSIRIADKTIYH